MKTKHKYQAISFNKLITLKWKKVFLPKNANYLKFINDLKAGIISKSNFEVLNGDFTGEGIFMLKIKGMHHYIALSKQDSI